jgi:hypothetical protein
MATFPAIATRPNAIWGTVVKAVDSLLDYFDAPALVASGTSESFPDFTS